MLKKTSGFVFALIVLSVGPTMAAKKLNFASMLETYKMEQIEQAGAYFMARVESDPLPKGEKLLACDPPMSKVNTWMAGTMKQLIDERRKREVDLYVRDTSSYGSRIKGCSEHCSCEAYKVVLELGGQMGTIDPKAHEANGALLKQEMRKVSPKFLRKCAERATWFCGSDLLKYLASPAGAKAK